MTNEEREIIEYVADIPLPVVKNTAGGGGMTQLSRNELAKLEPARLTACAWCSRGLGVCSCVGDCGTPLCAGEANAYIEGEDCR